MMKLEHVTPQEDLGRTIKGKTFVCCFYCGTYRPFKEANEDGWVDLRLSPEQGVCVCMYCRARRDPESRLLVWCLASKYTDHWHLKRVHNIYGGHELGSLMAFFHRMAGEEDWYCHVKEDALGNRRAVKDSKKTLEESTAFVEDTVVKAGWIVKGPRPGLNREDRD